MSSVICPRAAVPTSDRDQLVDDYLPLARRLARRYQRNGEPIDDLVQVASLGLVLAAERFDPSRGTAFASFAVPTIVGELRRHVRDHRWAARVPRSIQENLLRVSAIRDDLIAQLGRAPTSGELADEAGLSSEAVIEATEAAQAFDAGPLDAQTSDDDPNGNLPASILGTEDQRYAQVEDAVTLWPAVADLPQQERVVVALRFFEDLTQAEIAAQIGVSQMQVSRLLRRALDQIHQSTGIAA